MKANISATEIMVKQQEIESKLKACSSETVGVTFSSAAFDPKYLPQRAGDYELGEVLTKPDPASFNDIHCAGYLRREK